MYHEKNNLFYRKTAYLGVFTAAAVLLSYIETIIQIPFGVPGMKLGLANLAIVLILYLSGWRDALLVSFVRILLIGFMFGNLFSILFSMAGGFVSLLVMYLLKRSERFGIITVSITGGVSHNISQLAVAACVVENTGVLYYLPILMIGGVVTGLLIGLLSMELVKPLARIIGRNTKQ